MIKNIFQYILLFSFSLILLNCTLAGDGVDGAEDSGFNLKIKNFSSIEYNNCIFYMGYKDSNDKFITSDSLIYNNIVIYKKGDGNNFNSEKGFSLTYLFNQNKQGLNKYGMWEPSRELETQYYKNSKIFFKVSLQGRNSISSPIKHLNGGVTLNILENGDLSW